MPEKLFATFTARPGCEAEVDELLSTYGETVRREPGCLVFSASRRRDAPLSYFVYEEYTDAAAFRLHLAAEYGAHFNTAIATLIEEDATKLTLLDAV
ncbi:MAG: (4S)-4-hydroxy-5-phosphonooxypentane-2,3-dione isomerase [Actinomycetota bacterium]|jgi:quinol monooxygenase YgiN